MSKTTPNHEQRVQALCERFSLRMSKQGHLWIISGKNGIDIRTTDLATVRDSDLDRRDMLRTPWARQP
ncbi:MAG: hypothetical protein V4794_19495 [Pseudomonadota bacterium]